MTGKERCELFKKVRKEIAKANNINFEPIKCTYEGTCSGTCTVCDAEIEWLTRELDKKGKKGEFVNIMGIANELVDQASKLENVTSRKHEQLSNKVQKRKHYIHYLKKWIHLKVCQSFVRRNICYE